MSPKLSLVDHPFPHVFDPVPQVVLLKVSWLALAPFGLPCGALGLPFAHPGGRLSHFGRQPNRISPKLPQVAMDPHASSFI